MNHFPFPPQNDNDNDRFIWVTSFDEIVLKSFYAKFMQLEGDPSISCIPIIISSCGGDVYSLIAMRDIIKSSNKKVATVALGKAMSAGAFLLAAGSKGLRFASPMTQIMVHEMASGTEGTVTEVKTEVANMTEVNDSLFSNFAIDTGTDLKKIRKQIKELANADWNMDAKEAKRWGIIDNIDIPRIYEQNPMSALFSLKKEIEQQEREEKEGRTEKKPFKKK